MICKDALARDAINEALEAAAEEALQRRNALAEARKAAKAARNKQRDEELQRLMKECVPIGPRLIETDPIQSHFKNKGCLRGWRPL